MLWQMLWLLHGKHELTLQTDVLWKYPSFSENIQKLPFSIIRTIDYSKGYLRSLALPIIEVWLYCSIYLNTPNHHQSISNAAPPVQTSTLTPAPLQVLTSKTPHPLAQSFAQMRYRCKYQVLSTDQNILEVYRYYNITHISLRACIHCMYWYGILEGTKAWPYS